MRRLRAWREKSCSRRALPDGAFAKGVTMCMPSTDQVVQILRQHLNSAMKWVKTRVMQSGVAGDACNRCWSRAIVAALCHASAEAWGKRNRICANIPGLIKPACGTACRRLLSQRQHHICCEGQFGPYTNLGKNESEKDYDVSCRLTSPGHQTVLLAAESELARRKRILEDFRKLLVARAAVRVMVYSQSLMPFNELLGHILQGSDTKPGDTYLLAAFGTASDPPRASDNPRIIYYRIDAHQLQTEDQCELAPIQGDWYPGLGPPQP